MINKNTESKLSDSAGNPTGPSSDHGKPQQDRRKLPIWLMIVLDILVLGLALNGFALANNSLFTPSAIGEDLPQPTIDLTQQPTPAPTVEATTTTTATPTGTPGSIESPTTQPTPTAVLDQGMWGEKFAGKFTGGDVERSDEYYKSKDIQIIINKEQSNGIEIVVADIYIRNKANFQAFFHKDKFGAGIDSTLDQANLRNAILAINGDNSGNRNNRLGYEVRNGKLFHSVPWQDIFVMYNDGSMKAFGKAAFEKEYNAIKHNGGGNGGVWQIWTFGPMLLDDDGQPMTKFAPESITGPTNQRTAIGYFEPGHYCFVTVGSLSKDKRAGLSLADLSAKMHSLGCKAAYNMDGGQSFAMVFNGKYANTQYRGGRNISDIVGICEVK